MKIRAILLVVMLLCAVGCQPGNDKDAGKTDYSKVAGIWKSENKNSWQILITEDGKIESAIFPMGMARIAPNKTTYITMKDDTKSSFKTGDCPLAYLPDGNVLEVTIKVEHFLVRYLDNRIEGNHEAMISGVVSEDGMVWDASIMEVFDYGPRFPQGPNDIMSIPMKFHKIVK